MFRGLVLSLVSSISLCFIPSVTAGRLVENWPYERLNKEADLIVIATAVATKDTSDTFIDERWPLEFVGVNTTCEVLNTITGQISGKGIVVLHFKFGKVHNRAMVRKDQIIEIIDGPSFVSFRTTPARIAIDSVETENHKVEYLLFLKKRKDGRYEPVSGRIDPNLSVRELFMPIFSRSDGIKKEKQEKNESGRKEGKERK